MTAQDVRARAATAREHLQVALERVQMAPDGSSDAAQVAASNAVLAAIAAADALCGHARGFCATGQDHREAAGYLKALPDVGPRLAAKLQRLASEKSSLTYGGWCTRAEAARAAKDAEAFIDELDRRSL